MKKNISVLVFFLCVFPGFILKGQFSKENSGEIIFAFSNVEKNEVKVDTKMRFTLFIHAGQNFHYDFNNYFGIYSGYGLRNIGLIMEESDTILKRRTYSLGVPLAFKIGSFEDHFYFYGGGEYELFFHYKQKQYTGGSKNKESEWFSDRTERFSPSIFCGIQFPGGINLKFKYYPENFLNARFSGSDFGKAVNYSEYNKTRLFYIALSFNFSNKDLKKLYTPEDQPRKIASL